MPMVWACSAAAAERKRTKRIAKRIPRAGGSWYAIRMPKSGDPIPSGFHSLTPHITVNGAAKYIDFLKSAFNAVEDRRSPGPGGKLMHAQVHIGDSPLMFSDDFS